MKSAFAFLLPILAVIPVGCSKGKVESPIEDRIKQLEQAIEQQHQAGKTAATAYVPKIPRRLDDLGVPARDILRQLPGVSDVEVVVKAANPTHRIIHIRDWHFVPRDSYALDFEQATGKPLTDEVYRVHLLEVELVQLEQAALLRCLIKHHGLRFVLAEGLTPKAVPNFRDVIAALRDMDRSLTKLMKQRDELRQKDDGIEQGIAELQKELRDRLVPYGAPGRLALAEEAAVLPLDDDELLDRANPVRSDGKVKLDAKRIEARHDAQVKAAMNSGPCSLLILGGSHDLSTSVKRLGKGTCEYIRVTTTRFKEVAAGN